MEVLLFETYEDMSAFAARRIADRIRAKPNLVLGLATGSTPLGTYRELIRLHQEEGLDFAKVVTFNLDEYLGLAPTHDQSYRYFMDTNLFDHINIKKANTHLPDGMAKDPATSCQEYEKAIKAAGGIDFQVLGIGGNGHIAFNEPGSPRSSRTRTVNLNEPTIKDNSRFFASIAEVPRQALSMGMATIMEAREVTLLANKANKADAIVRSVEGPATEQVPASILQGHPRATFLVEKEAAAKLKRRYRKVRV
jgi:glucosamine-6-phosphate deaminase